MCTVALSTKCEARPECAVTVWVYIVLELSSKEESPDRVAAFSSEKAGDIQFSLYAR
jgi:hypothetical protein